MKQAHTKLRNAQRVTQVESSEDNESSKQESSEAEEETSEAEQEELTEVELETSDAGQEFSEADQDLSAAEQETSDDEPESSEAEENPQKSFRESRAKKSWWAKFREKVGGKKKERLKDSRIFTPEAGPLKFLAPSNIKKVYGKGGFVDQTIEAQKRHLDEREPPPPSGKRIDNRQSPKKGQPSRMQPTAGPSRMQPVAGPSSMQPVAGPSRMQPTAGPSRMQPVAGPSRMQPTVGPSRMQPVVGPSGPQTRAQKRVENLEVIGFRIIFEF